MPAARKRKGVSRTMIEASGLDRLDERFRMVPPFTGLRTFPSFAEVKQWTGVEQKAITRQIIPVVTPLLRKEWPEAIEFARALIDFVLIAQYTSHDDDTIRYLEQALFRVNSFKDVFRHLRPTDPATEQGHFNFPKFHAITHYTSFIRQYGAADGFDSSHDEARHKYMLKEYFGRTNKRDTFQEQLLFHNERRLNMLAMEDVLLHDDTNQTSMPKNMLDALVTCPSRDPLPLTLFNERSQKFSEHRYRYDKESLDSRYWCKAIDLAEAIDIPDFLPALATFVREQRKLTDGLLSSNYEVDRREKNPKWVEELYVSTYGSLTCWTRSGADSSNLEKPVKEKVRCKPGWQGRTGRWRRDYVWVQEQPEQETGSSDVFNGRLVGQLMVILTIEDPEFHDVNGKHVRYCGALLDLLKPRNKGIPCHISGMVNLQRWPVDSTKNTRILKGKRFYSMPTIQRSVHVVPDGKNGFFINNYANWETYNDVYDVDFSVKDERRATDYRRGIR